MEKEKTWIEVKRIGEKIQKNWKILANQIGLKIDVTGIPSLTSLVFKDGNTRLYRSLITQEMLKSNILASNTVYASISHTDAIIKKYFNKLENIFKIIKKCQNGHDINKFLKSESAYQGFKRLN